MKNFRKTIQQAQDSLKILETLEKEVVSRAKAFSKLPKRFPIAADEKILASLKALGLVTQAEFTALENRTQLQIGALTERLAAAEAQISTLAAAKTPKSSKAAQAVSADATSSTDSGVTA